MAPQPILLDGRWQASVGTQTFRAENPATKQALPEEYPLSPWNECERALDAAASAAQSLRSVSNEQMARFLERYAELIEAHADALVDTAHLETALPKTPRLAQAELPRTTNQIRQAAAAARDFSWTEATIDSKLNIRSCYAAIGPVCVFGPNNFPFAYGSCSGGDFASAIAAGNPVLAKAHPSHPHTTQIFAQLAAEAVEQVGLPRATVQLLYGMSYADGERLVADPRVAATGYTGSRRAGLKLKHAADQAGKPIYLELSSINPVVFLPGALEERGAKLVDEFVGSCLAAVGQMCTSPGLLIFIAGPRTEQFLQEAAARFAKAPVGTLLAGGVADSLASSIDTLKRAGAEVLVGGTLGGGAGYSYANTLLRVSAKQFLANANTLQTEAFGNESLAVVAADAAEAALVLDRLEANLTGSIYSSSSGADDPLYADFAPRLRAKVGRMLNDKMPTGVAVTAAMNHGGPYPATGHAGFTAVGFPAAIRRFSQLQCYDAVRLDRLPLILQNKNPTGTAWRYLDGAWSQADVQ